MVVPKAVLVLCIIQILQVQLPNGQEFFQDQLQQPSNNCKTPTELKCLTGLIDK